MHKYLRAVGFSNYKTRDEIQSLIVNSIKQAERKCYASHEGDALYAEYCKSYGQRIGICVRGEYDDAGKFIYDYMFPYLEGKGVSSSEDISLERHIDKIAYSGIIDDFNLGTVIIFYLQNIVPYLKYDKNDRLPVKGTSVTFSALSTKGTILFPIEKNEVERTRANELNMRNARMRVEARNGNAKAIENLTLQDIDINTVIHKKILEEDLYSLVDTSFMPYGVECDLYAIIGEITSVEKIINDITKEEMYNMTLDVSGVVFDVVINVMDLMGEPMEGRRFKGIIWLQGYINFPE